MPFNHKNGRKGEENEKIVGGNVGKRSSDSWRRCRGWSEVVYNGGWQCRGSAKELGDSGGVQRSMEKVFTVLENKGREGKMT